MLVCGCAMALGWVWYGHVLWFRVVFYRLLKFLCGLAVVACFFGENLGFRDWMAMEMD